jgi:hypothetical protein
MTGSKPFNFSIALSMPGVGMLYTMLEGSMKLSKPAMWSVRRCIIHGHILTSLEKGRYAVLNRWLNESEMTFWGDS